MICIMWNDLYISREGFPDELLTRLLSCLNYLKILENNIFRDEDDIIDLEINDDNDV